MKNTTNEQVIQSEQGLTKGFLGLYNVLAGGQKALVASILSGKQKEVSGPAIINPLNNTRLFKKLNLIPGNQVDIYLPGKNPETIKSPGLNYIHPDAMIIEYTNEVLIKGDKGWLYDEKGDYTEVSGPGTFNIHPDGELKKFQRIKMSENEVIVVIGNDGKEKIIKGKEVAEYLLNPAEESLKLFRWTGSGVGGSNSEKVPNALNFNKIRLDDSQTYFSFPVRTKDNVVVNLDMMIFYKISNLDNLVKNTHDPLSEFYNKIQSEICSDISKMSFDEFKEGTNEHISNIDFIKNNSFERIGIEITKIAIREWAPDDKDVQRVLEKSAMVQSQKTLDRSEHERKMKQIEFKMTEQGEEEKLSELKVNESRVKGEVIAKELEQIFKLFEELAGKEEAINLMKLYLAKEANELNIGSDMLR